MSEGVFLDTVGLIALLNQDDEYHAVSCAVFAEVGDAGREVVTSDLVLAEVGNGLARTSLREQVVWLIGQLHTDPAATVIYLDRERLERALALYARRGDKAWGLVDCVSFGIMEELGLTDAFSADRHFEQAGFRLLLRTSPAEG